MYSQNPPDIKLWDENKRDAFVENLNYEEISSINAMLDRISANEHVNNEDINEVINTTEKVFTSSAQLTFGPKYKHDNKKADNTKKKR